MSQRRQKIVSKSGLLVLHRPQHSRRPLINVRVTIERGTLIVRKSSRRCSIRPSSVNGEFDLKVVWVNSDCDVLDGNVRYSFEVLTPERRYILQAENHRAKIDWMQVLCIGTSQCLQFRGSYRPSSWSNLEDLQQWLSVREVEYEFKESVNYEGATYNGKWLMGKPEGMGSMEWPDGHRYDGEFSKGVMEGTGTMMWFSDHDKTSYTGSWRRGQEDGHGEMAYRDGSEYRGWWRRGVRHGHGRMVYKEPDLLYIGDWEDDSREGYGVLHDTLRGEHYLGLWHCDKYHGPAILISQRQRSGEELSEIEEEESSDGGPGSDGGETTLHCGAFKEGEKIDGTIQVTELHHDSKWAGLFDECANLLQQMVASSHSDPEVTHHGAMPSADEGLLDHSRGRVEEDEMIDIYRDYGMTSRSSHNKECLVCTMEGFKSASHPFGTLVNHLTRCFNESYTAIAEHGTLLLPHAIGELTFVAQRIHQLIGRLCPTVLQNTGTLGGRQTTIGSGSPALMNGGAKSEEDHTWLYPILLPSITDTLMTLYRAHCAVEDKQLSVTLKDLDKKTDSDLCELLELSSEWECWNGKDEESKSLTELLQPATQTFSKLRECRSPLNKLLCLQETNAEVTKVYKRLHPERDSLLVYSHDEQGQLISSKLVSFVIVRSQESLDCLSSEIHFISDFAGTVLNTEEYGYLLQELKGCYQQLSELYVDEDEWLFNETNTLEPTAV